MGTLDYLVVDLPPGTGDVAISLIQTVPLTGAIVVSTPSDVSLQDARKAIEMFKEVKVDLHGLIAQTRDGWAHEHLKDTLELESAAVAQYRAL